FIEETDLPLRSLEEPIKEAGLLPDVGRCRFELLAQTRRQRKKSLRFFDTELGRPGLPLFRRESEDSSGRGFARRRTRREPRKPKDATGHRSRLKRATSRNPGKVPGMDRPSRVNRVLLEMSLPPVVRWSSIRFQEVDRF